jgi:hypothetical protein
MNFSTGGAAGFTAPKQNTVYDVLLMNKSNGTNYELIDNQSTKWGGGILYQPRSATYCRSDQDGKTGPQEAIDNVIIQFNQALNLPWISYGNISKVDTYANIAIGYGYCMYGNGPVRGFHSTDDILVNPDVCRETNRNVQGVFIEELFELLTDTSDIHGRGSHVNGEDQYLTIEGQELLAYVYAKDEKTK